MFTRKLVQRIHVETLHGGVSLTMASIREQYWIPTLRLLVKSVRSACWGCKRFIASPLTVPPPGPLPTDRTNGGAAFEVIGTDFAGPIKYKQRKKSDEKAYLAIFTCSLSRAVHLELLSSLETSNFITCLKRLIAADHALSTRTMEAPLSRLRNGFASCEELSASKVSLKIITLPGNLT